MDEIEVVVAHSERATLRVGEVFLKVDADPARARREVEAMRLAPVPTPEVLWHRPPVLALAALPGSALGRLGHPSPAPAAAWSAAGAAARALHEAPLPSWTSGRSAQRADDLERECARLVADEVLPVDLVERNHDLAVAALRDREPAFVHGDLQLDHSSSTGTRSPGCSTGPRRAEETRCSTSPS